MTLKEALRIQTIDNDHNPNITDEDRWKAHQLGIEALKQCQRYKEYYAPMTIALLPGETEE